MDRVISLTSELVARCHRVVEDSGPSPGLNHLTDSDYEELVDKALASWPDRSSLWLFAYGSLIWKPEIEHVDERVAVLRGWHRSFCINQTRWRGTPECPGLMMGIDRGGTCRGVAFRLPDADPREQLEKLFRREMTIKPATYVPRWLRLKTVDGEVSALGFTVNRSGWAYAGRFDETEVARVLATACGHWGSGADYLYNTVTGLESRGIHDRHLWRLQELVAAEILARDSAVATVPAG
jgi:cation transport protein ChaC